MQSYGLIARRLRVPFFNLFFLIAAFTAKNANKLPFGLKKKSQLERLEFSPYCKILNWLSQRNFEGSQQDCSNSFVPISQNIKMMFRALLSQIVCLWIAGQNSSFSANPEMRSWTLPLIVIPTLLRAAGLCYSGSVQAGWALEEIWEISAAPLIPAVPQECWASPISIEEKVNLWAVAQKSLEGL